MTQRLFIAIDLSVGQKKELENMQHRLHRRLEGVRWVKPGSLHLTLRFLGDTELPLVAPIKAALDSAAAGCQPFELVFGGCGVFPSPGKARVLWVGLHRGRDQVVELAARLDERLAACGIEPERRPYAPHLTIGRVRLPLPEKEIRAFMEGEKSFISSAQVVEAAVLYESKLSRQGAAYHQLHRSVLG